jgi:peptide/nickel transport system substrate-binding protein
VFQQQLRDVDCARHPHLEFATFFADVTHGEFQMYSLRWVGGNEDPDIFDRYFTLALPNGSNRGYYSNTRVDV